MPHAQSFDFIVTIVLGSILATILLNHDVAYIEGIAAFLVLLAALNPMHGVSSCGILNLFFLMLDILHYNTPSGHYQNRFNAINPVILGC